MPKNIKNINGLPDSTRVVRGRTLLSFLGMFCPLGARALPTMFGGCL